MTARSPLRFLLLQARNADDPMRTQEVDCFALALPARPDQIAVHDLIGGPPPMHAIQHCDIVLLGGSGDYSVAAGGTWLEAALEVMRDLVRQSKPTFASCWGFQAMARALGGEVVTDLSRAEVGPYEVQLTPQGETDPVFGGLEPNFTAHMGHQDIVDRIPDIATCLASSRAVTNQAFRIDGKPIYCTQFHPELRLASFLQRLHRYPQYVERVLGLSVAEFERRCVETPQANSLLPRFIRYVRETCLVSS